MACETENRHSTTVLMILLPVLGIRVAVFKIDPLHNILETCLHDFVNILNIRYKKIATPT